MPVVPLTQMRDLLLPGLYQVTSRYIVSGYNQFGERVTEEIFLPTKPHIWVPKLTLPAAIAVGVAAAAIKNPIITRRFWAGWNL